MKMNTRQKHWFFFIATAIGAIVVVNLAILLMWTDMTAEERIFGKQIFGRVVTYGTLAMIVLFFISSQFILYIFRNYISPIELLTEETRLIRVANAKYRIKPVGALETQNLTRAINDLADFYISLKSDVRNVVAESKEGFEDEKMRMETLMNMIPEGVIICNHDGRILISNRQAYHIFNAVEHNEIGRFSRLGLGRSIFSVFNRTPVIYAFDQIQKNLAENKEVHAVEFITTRYKVQYLSIKIAQVLKTEHSNTISGYVFTINDITKTINERDINNYSNQAIILDELVSIVNMKTKNEFNFITEHGLWVKMKNLDFINLLTELTAQLKEFGVKSIGLGINENKNLQLNWSGKEINFNSKQLQHSELIREQQTIENITNRRILKSR